MISYDIPIPYKGQKCFICKREIVDDCCRENFYYYHEKCFKKWEKSGFKKIQRKCKFCGKVIKL